jgi:hypothetical protein
MLCRRTNWNSYGTSANRLSRHIETIHSVTLACGTLLVLLHYLPHAGCTLGCTLLFAGEHRHFSIGSGFTGTRFKQTSWRQTNPSALSPFLPVGMGSFLSAGMLRNRDHRQAVFNIDECWRGAWLKLSGKGTLSGRLRTAVRGLTAVGLGKPPASTLASNRTCL